MRSTNPNTASIRKLLRQRNPEVWPEDLAQYYYTNDRGEIVPVPSAKVPATLTKFEAMYWRHRLLGSVTTPDGVGTLENVREESDGVTLSVQLESGLIRTSSLAVYLETPNLDGLWMSDYQQQVYAVVGTRYWYNREKSGAAETLKYNSGKWMLGNWILNESGSKQCVWSKGYQTITWARQAEKILKAATFETSEPLGINLMGVRITSVVNRSQAELLGVESGWEVELINGRHVSTDAELMAAITLAKRGAVEMEIVFRVF